MCHTKTTVLRCNQRNETGGYCYAVIERSSDTTKCKEKQETGKCDYTSSETVNKNFGYDECNACIARRESKGPETKYKDFKTWKKT